MGCKEVVARVATTLLLVSALVGLPGVSFAAFSSSTAASLTSSVAKLDAPVPGLPATTQCTTQGLLLRTYKNVITIKPFGAVTGATAYDLLLYGPNGAVAATGSATPADGGTLTVTLSATDSESGWTYSIRAKRTFSADNTWTSLSARTMAPVTRTACS